MWYQFVCLAVDGKAYTKTDKWTGQHMSDKGAEKIKSFPRSSRIKHDWKNFKNSEDYRHKKKKIKRRNAI